jgi:hypothetical protein
MQLQDSARATPSQYRGADWVALQRRWTGAGRSAARSAAPAPSGARPGSSTHFDTYTQATRAYPGPSYLGILKSYGPNGGKLVLRTVHERPQVSRPDQAAMGELVCEKGKGEKQTSSIPRTMADPVNVEKSAWRARAKLEDWVRMTAMPGTDYRLCTGTKRGGLTTAGDALQAVERFRRLLERHHPGVKAAAVPELHKGGGVNHGTYHVHFMLVFPAGQRPIYSVFHRLWYRALGGRGNEKGADAPGNFDFAKTHAKDGKRYTACQGARYMAKYLTKDLYSGNVGQKRFTTSHGAPDPVKRFYWETIATSHDMTRAHAVSSLRQFFPADTFMILARTFNDGGDTYHVFSAEPVPK